jgi:hypothetical protein
LLPSGKKSTGFYHEQRHRATSGFFHQHRFRATLENNQPDFTMGSIVDGTLQMVYEVLLLFGEIVVVGWA